MSTSAASRRPPNPPKKRNKQSLGRLLNIGLHHTYSAAAVARKAFWEGQLERNAVNSEDANSLVGILGLAYLALLRFPRVFAGFREL
jgi:hypothetical protein